MALDMVHIGQKIKARYDELGIGQSAFARKIHKHRNTVTDIFDRESIDTKLLQDIGKALEFNFFRYYIKPEEVGVEREAVVKLNSVKVCIEMELTPDDMRKISLEKRIQNLMK